MVAAQQSGNIKALVLRSNLSQPFSWVILDSRLNLSDEYLPFTGRCPNSIRLWLTHIK